LLWAKKGAHKGDEEDHARQQHEDFGHVVEEKVDRLAQACLWQQADEVVGEPVGQGLQLRPHQQPDKAQQQHSAGSCQPDLRGGVRVIFWLLMAVS
jgi:hypothetical protein